MNKLAFAIAYARRGFRVFPLHNIEADRECSCGRLDCPSAGKHPRIKDWQALATTAERQIREWWQQWPHANVGVKTGIDSNLTVLDVDGDEGRDTLRELECEQGELPETPIAITGSGGAHYYFHYEEGLQNAVRFAPGLDIRSEGGLVVGVGSSTKRAYEWEALFTLGDTLLPSKMPEWLSKLIRSANAAKTNAFFHVDSEIPQGRRDSTLWALGRSLKAKGLSFDAIRAALHAENTAKGRPPLTMAEVEAKARHVWESHDQQGFGPKNGSPTNVWIEALPAPDYVAQGEDAPQMLVHRLAAPGALSVISGTRGLGKTNVGLMLAVAAATGGQFLGESLKPSRALYLNRDNPTATIRKRLRAWGGERADNLYILGRDKAPPLTDKNAWAQFPLNSYELVIVDSLSAFLESVDEKEGGANGQAVASVLDAAARSGTAFLILANTKRSGKAFRGSGVIGDRADMFFEARDATDLRLDPKRETWADCLPDPSDEAWGERAKRRTARTDYRVALICSKFRDGDEPEPFIVEIRHDDENGWSAREVTAEVDCEHERLKQAADTKRRESVERAVEKLRSNLPVAKNPDALHILKAAGLGRDMARRIIEEQNGKSWIISGSGTRADPLVLKEPETARKNEREENLNGEKGFRDSIPAGAAAQGPQESLSKNGCTTGTSETSNSCGNPGSIMLAEERSGADLTRNVTKQ
jgi:hypothetical protein